MATAGDEYTPTTTVGELRTQLIDRGYTHYPSEDFEDLGVYMHSLRSRAIVLVGADTDAAKVYQVQAVNNAVRRT